MKNWISYRDNALTKSFRIENNVDMENVGNTVEDLCYEKLHGEMNYIYEDGVEGSIEESGSNFMNKEGNEKNIEEGDEKVGGKENFEKTKDYNQGMHMGMMTQCMAMVWEG